MRFHRKLALSGTCVLVLFAVTGASQETSQETSQKELPEYCSKGGEIDWMAVLGKALEFYRNYASKQTVSKARSPLEDILIAALSQKAGNAVPQAPSESTANADAVNSAGTSQPDISAALLGSLLSNIGNADASSKKSTEADPMAGLKTLLDGLSALNSKDSGSAGQGAGSLDLSKLAPLVLQGLPSLLGSQGSGSQGSVLSLLGSLMGDQQSGQGLEKIFSQVLKTIFNPNREGKDGNLAEGLEPAVSGMIESLLKAGFKEDPSPKDLPKDAETPTLRTEL